MKFYVAFSSSNLMFTSVALKSCGHSFCEECHRRVSMQGIRRHCPECRSGNMEAVKNYTIRKLVAVLAGRCGRHPCPWQGTFGDYQQHVCLYEEIQCNNEGRLA